MRRLLRDLAGFVACLFESHDLVHQWQADWRVCQRRWCSEVRLTPEEFRYLHPTGDPKIDAAIREHRCEVSNMMLRWLMWGDDA